MLVWILKKGQISDMFRKGNLGTNYGEKMREKGQIEIHLVLSIGCLIVLLAGRDDKEVGKSQCIILTAVTTNASISNIANMQSYEKLIIDIT